MGDALGYARVSTVAQSARMQTDALEAAGCLKIFTDHASGKLDRRPELDRLLDHLRAGDTLVVWRLDRLGRTVRHLIDLVADLDTRQVGFRSLTENIDTTTTGGRLVFHIFAGLAQMERELISERTRAGLNAARARGRQGGRRPVMTPEKQPWPAKCTTHADTPSPPSPKTSASAAPRSTEPSTPPPPLLRPADP